MRKRNSKGHFIKEEPKLQVVYYLARDNGPGGTGAWIYRKGLVAEDAIDITEDSGPQTADVAISMAELDMERQAMGLV